MYDEVLWRAVARLADTMQGLPDEALGDDWTWRDHAEGMRFALIGSYHELRALAAELRAARQEAKKPISTAQYILGQYHAAFRDLQAVLLGIPDSDLDTVPAEGEWPLRRVLGHIISADLGFYSLVHYAVFWAKDGQEPRKLAGEDFDALVGTEEAFVEIMDNQGLVGIFDYYESVHNQVLLEASEWTQYELNAISPYWESDPLPVAYRLHRFDAHLRQHTIQVEKTLEAIGRKSNEARRLLRLVYNALAELESALIGAWALEPGTLENFAGLISERAAEIAEMTANRKAFGE